MKIAALGPLLLMGCQAIGDHMACDDQVAHLKARAIVYETNCYHGRYVSSCRTVPRTELRHTRASQGALDACVAGRRFARADAAAVAAVNPGAPPPPPAPVRSQRIPSPADSGGWHAFGMTSMMDRPADTGRVVHVLAYGQRVEPLAAAQKGWLRVSLDDGRQGFVPADRVWSSR